MLDLYSFTDGNFPRYSVTRELSVHNINNIIMRSKNLFCARLYVLFTISKLRSINRVSVLDRVMDTLASSRNNIVE